VRDSLRCRVYQQVPIQRICKLHALAERGGKQSRNKKVVRNRSVRAARSGTRAVSAADFGNIWVRDIIQSITRVCANSDSELEICGFELLIPTFAGSRWPKPNRASRAHFPKGEKDHNRNAENLFGNLETEIRNIHSMILNLRVRPGNL